MEGARSDIEIGGGGRRRGIRRYGELDLQVRPMPAAHFFGSPATGIDHRDDEGPCHLPICSSHVE